MKFVTLRLLCDIDDVLLRCGQAQADCWHLIFSANECMFVIKNTAPHWPKPILI